VAAPREPRAGGAGVRAGRSPRGRMARGYPRGRRRRGAGGRGASTARAQGALSGFRRATLLAVAITAFLLMVVDPGGEGEAQAPAGGEPDTLPDTVAVIEPVAVEDLRAEAEPAAEPEPMAAAEEAAATLAEIAGSFLEFLPRLLIAFLIFAAAGLLVHLLRPLLRRALASFERAEAYAALFAIAIWLLALGTAFGVMAGDVRALLGSLGLIGLALSWALQAPIESFTGWLLNSFRGYYRIGDRVAVGEVFGDVYRIDVLTTTVWEYGGPDRPPHPIRAEQPTGRLITFPNNEVLTGTVVNYTRDFPYVWDELAVPVANESELRYAMEVLRRVAAGVVGEHMREPARVYEGILAASRLELAVADEPQVFVSLAESWTDLTIRYLVAARERRRWKSELALRVMEELAREEHRGRILPAYPRRQVRILEEGGSRASPPRSAE
jgi:small-conductance mechanosensitive channel